MKRAEVLGSILITFKVEIPDEEDRFKDDYLIKKAKDRKDDYLKRLKHILKEASNGSLGIGLGTTSTIENVLITEPVIVYEDTDSIEF